MKILDHFEELWPPTFGTPRGSLRDFLGDFPYEDEKEIIRYLQNGHDLFNIMGSSDDALGSGEAILGGDSIYSDGEWVWRGDLWFYVRKHHVILPAEFVDRVRKLGHSVPDKDIPRLMEIAQEIRARI